MAMSVRKFAGGLNRSFHSTIAYRKSVGSRRKVGPRRTNHAYQRVATITKKLDLPKAQFHHVVDKRGKKKFPGVVYLIAGDGDKHFYIRYRTPDGKQKFEKAFVPGVTMTAKKADDLRRDKARGLVPTNRERRAAQKAAKAAETGKWTFQKLFDAYMESRGEYPRRATDAGNFTRHLQDVVGGKEPKALSAFDVDRIKRAMLKVGKVKFAGRKGDKRENPKPEKYTPGTVNVVLGLLVRLSSFGVKRRLCPGIPFPVERVKDGAVRTEAMTDEQMSVYVKTAMDVKAGVAGRFLAFELLTGMRLNEVRNLVWTDVDLHHGAVHIRDPKGGRDQFIPLSKVAVDLLEELPRDEKNPYVFQGAKGGRIGIGTVQKYGRSFAKDAGLPEAFRPCHGLRHSFASHLASSGQVDMYVLQRLLTHKSPTMTQRYSHLRDEALRRGADVMNGVVAAAAKERGTDENVG